MTSLLVARAASSLLLLTVLGCSAPSSSDPTAGGVTATDTQSTSALSSTPTMAVKVASTLDGMSVLPHRVHWEAKPSVAANVSEVDFLIDSQLAWTERNAPYFYGDDGNWLVTSFLTPGRHQFETTLITKDGQRVTDKVVATVETAKPPPSRISGNWTRVVTSADVSKASSGQPPPAGRWSLTINQVGWALTDPSGPALRTDVAYPAAGRLMMRPTIETPPFPNAGNGAFCHEPDPEWAWTYVLSDHGQTLTLNPAGSDPCGDREAIYQGRWTRTSP